MKERERLFPHAILRLDLQTSSARKWCFDINCSMFQCSKMLLLLVKSLIFTTTLLCLLDSKLAQASSPTSTDGHHASEDPEPTDNPRGRDDMWSMVATMREHGKSPSTRNQTIQPIKNAKFDWNINLDQHGRYQLNWRVNYPRNKILFALEINTSKSNFSYGNDIFALGFSERGELSSSDFCLIWFDLSHRIHLQDARTDSNNLLELVDSSKSVCKLLKAPSKPDPPQSSEIFADENKDESVDKVDEEFADSVGERIDVVTNLNELDRKELAAKGPHSSSSSQAGSDDVVHEIFFKRPLEVCDNRDGYYTIDNGTTHLVWFTMKGPILSLDRLNLTEVQHSSVSGEHSPQNQAEATTGLAFESGLRRAQLIATKPSLAAASSSKTNYGLDIRMDKFEVPGVETTYWCKLFKLPEKFESRRFHITQYEAVIEPGNEHVVHHMELFNCATSSQEQLHQLGQLYYSQGGWSGECSSSSRPTVTDVCRRVILAWAMGAKPLVYPEQVGQSIGGQEYSPYVVLEVHYNNVAHSKGLVDSSGLRFHYSPELRPFDAGVLEIGLEYTDKNSIPPNMVVPLAGYCVSECTRAAMSSAGSGSLFPAISETSAHNEQETTATSVANDDHDSEQDHAPHNQRHRRRQTGRHQQQQQARHRGLHQHRSQMSLSSSPLDRRKNMRGAEIGASGIHIFAAQMHTHLTGVASWTEHVRGGRVLGEIQRDDHYSPHFQEIRLLPKPVHVEPGDALIHYCLYDTRSRSNITLGGYATTDEMCVSYLHYYPKIDLEVCKSSVDSWALEKYFASLARDELQNTSERLDFSGWKHSTEDEEEEGEEEDKQNYGNDENGGNGGDKNNGAGEGDENASEGEETHQANDNSKSRSTKTNADGSGAPVLDRRSVSLNYHSINWSPRRARELIEFYSTAPLSVQCNRSDGSRWPGNWNNIEPTRLVKWPGRQRGAAKWGGPKGGAVRLLAARSSPVHELDFFERPSAWELVTYRGLGHKQKHAQCQRPPTRDPRASVRLGSAGPV
uniref:Dopamine beta-hydroxylase n=1 Tax=Aceria tosichella TaxID=561515 RepID=A0A6G1SKP1_9ACAR